MQPSFSDEENRLAQLEKLGDPLPRLESIVDWNDFKPLLKVICQKKRKSKATRRWQCVDLLLPSVKTVVRLRLSKARDPVVYCADG